MPPRHGGHGGRGAQKRAPAPLPDAVGAKKQSSTPSTSGRSAHNGAADKAKKSPMPT